MKKIYTTTSFKKHQHFIAYKRHQREMQRKGKVHILFNYQNKDLSSISPFIKESEQRAKKKLIAPIDFSFINNTEESLKFFYDMLHLVKKEISYIVIDMRETKNITAEVLLYIVSLNNIFKKSGKNIKIRIKAPKSKEMNYLLLACGLTDYFKANVKEKINEKNIFRICDKSTNEDDGITCANVVDFCKQFFKEDEQKDIKFLALYEAIAELMTNTDQHAYPESALLSNWYLFANKVETGIAFFFFDNGKGILKTARKKLIEVLKDKTYGLAPYDLLLSTLNGQFRSRTGLPYRNKGLPQINDFLTRESVSNSIILTNNIFADLKLKTSLKLKYAFDGSFFIWIVSDKTYDKIHNKEKEQL